MLALKINDIEPDHEHASIAQTNVNNVYINCIRSCPSFARYWLRAPITRLSANKFYSRNAPFLSSRTRGNVTFLERVICVSNENIENERFSIFLFETKKRDARIPCESANRGNDLDFLFPRASRILSLCPENGEGIPEIRKGLEGRIPNFNRTIPSIVPRRNIVPRDTCLENITVRRVVGSSRLNTEPNQSGVAFLENGK